jgi:cytoskeletal protein CcmA (bactofilin family)/ribosomal protein S27E
VARPSPKLAGKINATCPHCHHVQLESSFAKSTICRACSHSFEIAETQPVREETPAKSSIFSHFGKLISREHVRDIRCYQCGAGQHVSSSAKSSICPQCGTYLDLRDFKISGTFSRSVQTQGLVHITSRGDVTSSKVACGTANIEGKFRGNLLCTGTTRVKMKGKLFGAVETHHLVVEKGAAVEFIRPVKVVTAEIRGRVSARIMCEGVIDICKSGELDGVVYAKSITVDKGGIFHGELYIGRRQLQQPELLPSPEPGILPESGELAFG